MIRAVLSFLLRPLIAVSSVLLKTHSLFLTHEAPLLILLHVQYLYQYLLSKILKEFFHLAYSYPMLSVVLSFLALMHQDRKIGIDKPSEK